MAASWLSFALVLRLAAPFSPGPQPWRSPRTLTRCRANGGGALGDTAAAINSIWTLPCTGEGVRRVPMATETREGTHATLWGQTDWDEHTRRDRLLRVVLLSPWSRITHALVPTLLPLAAWTSIAWRLRLTLTTTALGYLASPLGLLLAFRVNSVVARFHEARAIWGKMIFTARDLASTLAATPEDELPLETRALCCRWLVAYAWCAKAAMRVEDDIAPLLETLLPEDDRRRVASARKPALALLSLLRGATMNVPFKGSHVARSIHRSIAELNLLYGGLERLLSTPLSPTYMRHTQRGLLLWLFLLPCGLMSAGCQNAFKLVLIVLSVSYIMLGIDEIAIQIEQPFEVLPLHLLAGGLTKDVADEILLPGYSE